jgi:hypothetical protein
VCRSSVGWRDRPAGWVAVSETLYRLGRVTVRKGVHYDDPTANAWMDSSGTLIRVGHGIRLYHFPTAGTPNPTPPVRP